MHSNTEHLKNDNEEWNGVEMQASTDSEKLNDDKEEWNTVEMQATEQLAMDNDDEELNDSYLSILVDCIRVMISQAANEEEARSIILQALAEEFPKYFRNDKVIDCLLALSNKLCNGIVLESKVTDSAGVSAFEQNEDKLVEDVAASQEEDHEYVSAITDEELISMISDILSNSCETGEGGAPYFLLKDHDASQHRPVSPMADKEEENQQHELQDAKESKIDNTDEDGSVEISSPVPLLDHMHFLPGSASEGSYLESTQSQRGSLRPVRKESLDGSFSWPSLPGQSRIPASEDEFDRDIDAFSAVRRYAFSTPTCVITTSSCQSCKDAEQEPQSIEPTSAPFRPTANRLSLSRSALQGSFSEVLSKLTQAKRSGYKGKTATARELWSDSQEKDTSIFNASFSISSLEDMLSPERIPPSPSSPVFGSPEKSPNVLGIRLHKPAGFKDIFLSIVDQDKKTALPHSISDTWTLGTREEMELILHIDTNPHQNATRTYSGRYCLVFNDISDLEEYLSNEDSQEDFGLSMLSNDDNSKEERVSTSDEEYGEGFQSCEDENQEPIVSKISQANNLEKKHIIALESKEEKHQKEDELPQNEKSNHDEIKGNGSKGEKRPGEELPQDEKFDHDQSHSAEKLHEDSSRDKERIFAFACLALTSYLAHRYFK